MSWAAKNQQKQPEPTHSLRRRRFTDPPGWRLPWSADCFHGMRPATNGALLHFLACMAALLLLLAGPAPANAQNAVLGRGDAVVTGFSGIRPADVTIPPGGNPLDEFFIDPDGASAQIQSLGALGQPPQGQVVTAPSKLHIKAQQVGQVFAIALDDGQSVGVPNIYLGATAAYGLNIVLPDSDGDGAPERVTKGHPNATWMAGQFGLDAGGGPGAIWKVDGVSGAVSLFATLPENSGPGVGDVVFDASARQFFASDLDSGRIFRLSVSGEVIDSFDHGVAGRPRKGLPPVGDDGSRIDIKNAAFDSQAPGTWGFTSPERRVHGMAIRDGRLYYAVDGQVWSVGIAPNGFADDARWEFDAQSLPGDGPVTDMLFDAQGRIYLAQRGGQRNSYDYSVFAEAEKSNVTRYRREEPDNPATESVWLEEPEAYAIGLPPEHHHAEGGIALGYAHGENGNLRYGACGDMLWSTGHRLRPGTDDAETTEADVHGLQGNDVSLTRPQNTPPQQSYFTDYDALFGDAAKSGHVGDVEIWQPCEQAGFAPSFGPLPPGFLPPGDVPFDLPDFPEEDYHANLRLTKIALPKVCWNWAGGWLCRYRIRITNTGPDNYAGPLLVDDWLPTAPAGALMGFAPTPPWNCWATGPAASRCFRPGIFLAPGWSTDLTAVAWVPKSYPLCHLPNGASIQWAPPGSQWNSNPFDDTDFAAAIIPAEHCKPGDRTDLKIYKVPYGKCFPFGGKIRCVYAIAVQNVGLGVYNGVIQVKDTVPAGTTAVFGGAPWAPCAGPVGSTYTCTHPGANLAPGAFAPPIFVGVDIPVPLAKQANCRARNHAEIALAPAGSPQNIDPTNDAADAVAIIPPEVCEDVPPRRSNLKIEKVATDAPCLVTQDWCRTFRITVTNTGTGPFSGNITLRDIAPVGTTVQAGGVGVTCNIVNGGTTAICTTDNPVNLDKNPPSTDRVVVAVTVSGSAADARALNCRLTNKARIDSPLGAPKNIHAGDDMDQATVGLPAHLCHSTPVPLCPPGYLWDGQRCDRPDPGCKRGWTPTPVKGRCCPPGQPWNQRLGECGGDTPPPPPPPPVCPDGYRGKYPDCWKPEVQQCNRTARCIGGKVWSMDACACICPQGRVMRHGKCVADQPECPQGTTGTPPRCKPIVVDCPPGMTGKPPHCRPVVKECPRGFVGTPPNCRRQICPQGTRGVYPKCRPVVIDPPRPCPRGTVGRYPKCRPIIRVCPPGMIGRPPLCRRIDIRPQGGPIRPGGRLPRPDNGPRITPRPASGQGPVR